MIVFDLECSNGHVFEGWFNSIRSFEEQNVKNLVSCPYCNDSQIRRVLSPVTMKTSSPPPQEGRPKESTPIDYRRLAREIVDYVNKSFEDVGTDFAKEALKMHYGVTEKRSIRGSATKEEEDTLTNENIDFLKITLPKTDDEKKS